MTKRACSISTTTASSARFHVAALADACAGARRRIGGPVIVMPIREGVHASAPFIA
jgi:hypothetical protein